MCQCGGNLFFAMPTPFHSAYWAHQLALRSASDSMENLSKSFSGAKVDLNPHQVDAALFAFRSPLSKGAILADEVGLGKTIEAGLVISQKWAERKRRILLVLPATLRSQWQDEIDARRSHLIAEIKGQLKTVHGFEMLFTIQWVIRQGGV